MYLKNILKKNRKYTDNLINKVCKINLPILKEGYNVKVDNNVSFQKIADIQKASSVTKEKTNRQQQKDLDVKTTETEKESTNYPIENLTKTIEGLNQFLKPANTSLHFQLHDELDKYYVQLVDKETEEVIKEIPSEKLLDIYANMLESIGLLVDHKI